MEMSQAVATTAGTSGIWLPSMRAVSNGETLPPFSMMVRFTESRERWNKRFRTPIISLQQESAISSHNGTQGLADETMNYETHATPQIALGC